MSSIQASYGQTLNVCMNVVPAASANFNALPHISFGSNPQGALQGSFGGTATCASPALPVQIIVSTSSCVASASFLVLVGSKTVTSLPGTITLPSADTADFQQNHNCSEINAPGPGGIVEWTLTFNGSSAANFNGLFANETLTPVPRDPATDPPACGISPVNGGRAIGETGPNQVIDNMGTCGTVLLPNCQSVFLQTVTVGACTVQTNKLFFVFSSGTFYTERQDPSGSSTLASPPIAQ